MKKEVITKEVTEKVPEDKFPFLTTIAKKNDYLEFT